MIRKMILKSYTVYIGAMVCFLVYFLSHLAVHFFFTSIVKVNTKDSLYILFPVLIINFPVFMYAFSFSIKKYYFKENVFVFKKIGNREKMTRTRVLAIIIEAVIILCFSLLGFYYIIIENLLFSGICFVGVGAFFSTIFSRHLVVACQNQIMDKK